MILNYGLFAIIFTHVVICRDFYAGMFKNNDFLVAQDRLYKERVPYSFMYAKYGRLFKCPITYLRVVDRLGVGNGPQVQVVRGGIRYKYVVIRLRSPYNLPISVNIYIGCENKMKIAKTTRVLTTAAHIATTLAVGSSANVTSDTRTNKTDSAAGSGNSTKVEEATTKAHN